MKFWKILFWGTCILYKIQETYNCGGEEYLIIQFTIQNKARFTVGLLNLQTLNLPSLKLYTKGLDIIILSYTENNDFSVFLKNISKKMFKFYSTR